LPNIQQSLHPLPSVWLLQVPASSPDGSLLNPGWPESMPDTDVHQNDTSFCSFAGYNEGCLTFSRHGHSRRMVGLCHPT
jgi:hypothetical protein